MQAMSQLDKQYQEVPAEITRLEILKAPAPTLREWSRIYGWVNLNRRLQGTE
jgi:hypothetical protein